MHFICFPISSYFQSYEGDFKNIHILFYFSFPISPFLLLLFYFSFSISPFLFLLFYFSFCISSFFLLLLLFPFAWLGAIKDSFNDEEDRFSDLKKQKLRAEQKEFEDVKAKMAYDKGKMDSMRRQVLFLYKLNNVKIFQTVVFCKMMSSPVTLFTFLSFELCIYLLVNWLF